VSPAAWPSDSLTSPKFVEIDVEDPGCGPSGDELLEPVHQQRPIGEVGELIVQGKPFELVLRVLAIRDLADVADHVADVGIVDEVRRVLLEPAHVAVGVEHPELDANVVAEAGHGEELAERPLLVVRVDEVEPVPATSAPGSTWKIPGATGLAQRIVPSPSKNRVASRDRATIAR
jgi:hypothetical protein